MAQAIERMLANNLADFEGLKIEGTIVVSEALINTFIQDYVDSIGKEPPVNTPPATSSAFDPQKLLQALRIEQVNVHLQEGKMNIQLKISK